MQIKSKLHPTLGFEVWVIDDAGNRRFTCFTTMLQDGYDQAQAAISRLTA